MSVELFEHNKQTYHTINAMFEERSRVGVVQPTGTGKSFLYLKWIEDHPNDTFAVLSPSNEIFTQLHEYAEASGAPELLDSVQMISYQSLQKMTDDEIRAIHVDKMVLDEFHRTGAELWGPAVQRLLSANPDTKVLGASATPVRYLDNSKDMSTELFDRNLAVEMTLGEAVQRKILPTPKYIPVWYDIDDTLGQYERDISRISDPQQRKDLEEKLQLLKRRLEDSYGAEDIFQKQMPHNHGKFIVFCRSQEHITEMMQTMPKWLAGINPNIHSYVSISAQEDKDEQLKSFKDDKSEDAIKLLFTIDRLNEGLHVKGIDGVIMLRPTMSPIVYLQQMGRALSVGNETPLIFDMVNNYQSVQIPLGNGDSINVFEKEFKDAMEDSKEISSFRIFEDMMDFTALFSELESKLYVSFDDRWEQHFSILERFVSENERFPFSYEVYEGFQIGVWTHTQKHNAKSPNYPADRYKKLEALGLFETYRDVVWDKNFNLVKEFVAEYNRLPSDEEVYKGANIGHWVYNQLALAKKESYPADRYQLLEDLGILGDRLGNRWDHNYQLLQEFVSEFDRFPKAREEYKGVTLGAWCNVQKTQLRLGKLSPERQEKLGQVGLFNDTLADRWNQKFHLLQAFSQLNGRLPYANEMFKGVKLGQWMHSQINRREILETDRQNKLAALGVFTVSQDSKWDQAFNLLKDFVSENNRFPTTFEVYKGFSVGKWVANQKTAAKKPTFPKERLEKLQSIGFAVTDKRDVEWDQNFALLEKFVAEHGRPPKATEIYHEVKLGNWYFNQKTRASKSDYPEERLKKLQTVVPAEPRRKSLDELIKEAQGKGTGDDPPPGGGAGAMVKTPPEKPLEPEPKPKKPVYIPER